jgi:hypothetical protein
LVSSARESTSGAESSLYAYIGAALGAVLLLIVLRYYFYRREVGAIKRVGLSQIKGLNLDNEVIPEDGDATDWVSPHHLTPGHFLPENIDSTLSKPGEFRMTNEAEDPRDPFEVESATSSYAPTSISSQHKPKVDKRKNNEIMLII